MDILARTRIREVEIKYKPIKSLEPPLKIANSNDLFMLFRDTVTSERVEVFWTILLDCKNQIICVDTVARGSLSTSVVHPREVFTNPVRLQAAAVLFVHNHPSGDPAPSREDRECTQRLCRAGKIIGIRVLDHIVIGFDDYFSFADAGQLDLTE